MQFDCNLKGHNKKYGLQNLQENYKKKNSFATVRLKTKEENAPKLIKEK